MSLVNVQAINVIGINWICLLVQLVIIIIGKNNFQQFPFNIGKKF